MARQKRYPHTSKKMVILLCTLLMCGTPNSQSQVVKYKKMATKRTSNIAFPSWYEKYNNDAELEELAGTTDAMTNPTRLNTLDEQLYSKNPNTLTFAVLTWSLKPYCSPLYEIEGP